VNRLDAQVKADVIRPIFANGCSYAISSVSLQAIADLPPKERFID